MGVSSAETAVAGGVHGFPAELTSFIGRDGPVRDVAGLLAEHRLVTVTGPGGVGKTRLAGEVARAVAGRFVDGAWLTQLAPVSDAAQVAGMVAAALGVREQPDVPAAEALARVLARQQLLLVLDNCEHLIGAAAELCAGLLGVCDDIRVLATSREPLRTAGEARYRLAPLALPAPGGPGEVSRAEAVRLFADRARQVDARFAVDEKTGPAVARLVTRLDGMPLAIELAAARVEALGAGELADRLDDRFAVLTAGDRLAPSRHRSLAAAVEWSYRLLGEDERRVFRQLSVFPGLFTLEAAEAVAGPGTGAAVLHLVDCSLLVPPRDGPDGRSRYGMLETLRAYGAALLVEAGEADGAAAALAGWAVQVAEQAAAGLQAIEGEAAALRRLDAEDATMRQVLAWAMDHDLPAALRLVAALGWWWYLRGRLASQYPLLRQAADRSEPGGDGWCAAQFWLARTAQICADLPAALRHATVLRDAAAERGPCRALADGQNRRGAILGNMGQFAESADEFRRALAVAREIGYPAGEAQALMYLGYGALFAGDHDSAVQLARQAAQISADVSGVIARWCNYSLADVLIGAGDLAAAEPVCAAALAWSRDAGDLWNKATLVQMMATLDLAAGRTQDAAAHLRESLQITRTGTWFLLLDDLDYCGHLCVATGRLAEALTVWAALGALVRRGGFLPNPPQTRRREESQRQARQALGPARARAAEDRGAAMSTDTAAEYALMLTDPGPPQPAAPGPGPLSSREQELVTLVAQGCTDAQIAEQLYISIRTVRSHLDRIRDKTGCRRRADLTRLALSTGLI